MQLELEATPFDRNRLRNPGEVWKVQDDLLNGAVARDAKVANLGGRGAGLRRRLLDHQGRLRRGGLQRHRGNGRHCRRGRGGCRWRGRHTRLRRRYRLGHGRRRGARRNRSDGGRRARGRNRSHCRSCRRRCQAEASRGASHHDLGNLGLPKIEDHPSCARKLSKANTLRSVASHLGAFDLVNRSSRLPGGSGRAVSRPSRRQRLRPSGPDAQEWLKLAQLGFGSEDPVSDLGALSLAVPFVSIDEAFDEMIVGGLRCRRVGAGCDGAGPVRRQDRGGARDGRDLRFGRASPFPESATTTSLPATFTS